MQFGTHGNGSLRTVVSNSGAILPSGDIRSLGVEQLGFFRVTEDGNPALAQSAPTYKTTPDFFIGRGLAPYAAQDALGARQSKFPWQTPVFNGLNITKWEGTKAKKESTTDVWTLGYDGVDASKRLVGVLDHRELVVRLRLWGTPIRKLTGVSKDLKREYYIDKGCLDACKVACVDDFSLADELIADSILKQFRADKFNMIPISRFVEASKIKLCNPAEAAIGGLVESTQYTISFCDDGTSSSIGLIQTQYPGFKIKFESRAGAISTYSMWRLTTQGAPASFTNSVPVSLAVCNECPSGYTLQAAQKAFLVERPVGTSDVSTPSAQQTYANSIGTQYGNDGTITSITVTNGGSGYTSAPSVAFTGGGGTGAAGTAVLAASGTIKSVTITAAGSGYTNGTYPVVFAGGGGTGAAATITISGGAVTAVNITNAGSGYTTAPTATFTGAGAGTGATLTPVVGKAVASVTITNNGSGYTGIPTVAFTGGAGTGATGTVVTNGKPVVQSSKFVAVVDGVAKVLVYTNVDAVNSAFVGENSDVVTYQDTAGALCIPPAGASIAWTAGDTRQVAPKSWQLTLQDTVCGLTRLPELQQAYPELVVAEEGTAGNCSRIYITTNYSEPVLDVDCAPSEYVFEQPESFLFNTHWKPYVAPILTVPNCDPEEEDAVCCAVGIRFETAAFNHDFSECAYGYYSWDPTDSDPVYMELTVHTHDWTTEPCYETDQAVTKLRGASFSTGSGKLIREAERSSLQYEGKYWTTNAAHNEAYGVVFAAKPYEWYDTYRLTVKIPQQPHHITGHSTLSRELTLNFAFPTGKGKDFETLINNYVLSLDNPKLKAVIL